MSKSNLYFFSAADVARAVSMEETVELMRDAFQQLSLGQVSVPQRLALDIPENDGSALFMPVYSPENKRLGVKLVSVFHRNPAQNLPTVQALVFVMDGATGKPLAIMDGEYLTALRTGAASGLATDLLARQNSETVAIFGAGAQGRTQIDGVWVVRDIKKVIIFDRDAEKAELLAREISVKYRAKVTTSANLEDLRKADIICTATNSQTPVFKDKYLKKGVHINAIGAYDPNMSEIPVKTVARSKIVTDQRSACLKESGDLIEAIRAGAITENDLYAELGEIAARQKAGRRDETEITLFKSVGNAIQDLVTANRVLENAPAKGIGIKLNL
jgi:ornithine cyclodeaminase/alanine dehydrogenase-like protein (mu-crystallin family)